MAQPISLCTVAGRTGQGEVCHQRTEAGTAKVAAGHAAHTTEHAAHSARHAAHAAPCAAERHAAAAATALGCKQQDSVILT